MAGTDWSESVEIAVHRHAARRGSAEFTLQDLIGAELDRIVRETGSRGVTPQATLRRELQELRDRGGIDFVRQGLYRLRVSPLALPTIAPSKCAFVIDRLGAEPERLYRFAPGLLDVAARAVGQWIVYSEPTATGAPAYRAVARVEQIVRDPAVPDAFLALIEPGSYLEFGRDVAVNANFSEPIIPISDETFDRILASGLIDEDELLPREDDGELAAERLHDPQEQEPFLGPVQRESVLTNRKVRDRQFRKRVLDAYECRCALTGMRLINGGGRAEVQAAHIMSVAADGPDTEVNGIALSGTVHWMFDRGLISLSDRGDILLSSKIGDSASVERLLYPDRRARLPANENLRPHRRYLAWHREYHQFAA